LVEQAPGTNFNLMFSESTCYGVSKISNLFFERTFGLTSLSA
jgi:hypothetical protein